MTLALLDKVKKYYGDRLILDIEKLEILEGERIGLVGENGAGKTTLLKALIGHIPVEQGKIFLTDSYSYISQNENYTGGCAHSKIKKLFNAPDKYEDFLSGGEKVKLKVVEALNENKSLIIADEPTSNLDSNSVKLLEDMLKSYKGALLIVSHDRKLLDGLCNTIVEIQEGKISKYSGNYSKYVQLKNEERKRKETEYEIYISEKKRLENAILVKQRLRDSIKSAPRRMGNSEARLHKMGGQKAKKNIDSNIKTLKKRIDHLEVKQKPKIVRETKIKIQENLQLASKYPIEVKDLNLFAGDKLLLKEVEFKIRRGEKAALIGDNGCGKSTLLKEILNKNNKNIKLANKVVIGYFDQSQDILEEEKTILKSIKDSCSYDESFIRINLDQFGFKGDDVFKKVNTLSGGERVKVILCKILISDNNVLILDEPTNYLDIKSMKALEEALINTNKTVLVVSHDREFISNVCDHIIEIQNKNIVDCNGSYEELIKEKDKLNVNKFEEQNKHKLMVLENRHAEIISRLSIEKDPIKKSELDNEYNELLKEIKILSSNF
ncbi:ABC-F type ribosomal protection protein [Clostridium polyendosporum]|uniref:ABC-F type ribosomal protection protein n=1 Tax=Clostridium polyendosporum TaxID=69208 RepID=A0A919VG74_9CLOT|nr:ABC-F type ribosomal protection protein CplR [Clostridium polyendosporum]GIM29130.1 ABC-F type ribosomal protection protein [Clostridium polyendosporum]